MSKKNPSKNPSALVPQPHGGALLPGAGGGPQPGSGRPPSAIREYCRGSFAERVKILEQIADGEAIEKVVANDGKAVEMMRSARPSDRIKAIEVLGKYGGVDKIALTVEEQPEQAMTPERVADMWERLQRIKTMKQFEKMLLDAAKKQIGDGK